MAEALERTALRDGIAEATLKLIVSGALPPGSRLKDSDLAERLGTSRTPAREAMVELARRGFLKVVPRCGFRVPPLERQEILELYPLVATLESLAMESSEELGSAQARALVRLGRSLGRKGQTPMRWLTSDRKWHEALLAGCANTRLTMMLRDLRLQIQRYELLYARLSGGKYASSREHSGIVKAFREGDRNRAAELLRSHWERGMDEVLRHLE